MFERNRYIDMIVSAFQSVIATSATATDRMSAILHWFDGAVSDASLPGCSQGMYATRYATMADAAGVFTRHYLFSSSHSLASRLPGIHGCSWCHRRFVAMCFTDLYAMHTMHPASHHTDLKKID